VIFSNPELRLVQCNIVWATWYVDVLFVCGTELRRRYQCWARRRRSRCHCDGMSECWLYFRMYQEHTSFPCPKNCRVQLEKLTESDKIMLEQLWIFFFERCQNLVGVFPAWPLGVTWPNWIANNSHHVTSTGNLKNSTVTSSL